MNSSRVSSVDLESSVYTSPAGFSGGAKNLALNAPSGSVPFEEYCSAVSGQLIIRAVRNGAICPLVQRWVLMSITRGRCAVLFGAVRRNLPRGDGPDELLGKSKSELCACAMRR